jgi:hypothetical protein
MVRKFISAAMLSMSLMSLPVMVGCDREVSSEKKVVDGPNGTRVEEKKTVQKSDGTVEKTTEKHSTNP